ncbi:signal peptidase II [Aliidiomarina celeris]|uniref:signal peptidase II n=1 Tax=Aliidiomarina celeris TaxID=2249428 RepID=UPI000DE84A4F|nr:signal peptidase II [Aliidiomarina celeris]
MSMEKPQHWRQSGLKLLWLSALIVVLDQATKFWITHNLVYMVDRIEVLPFFDIIYVLNPGAAFSFLSDQSGWQRWFFALLAIVISAVLAVMLRKQPQSLWRVNVAFALIIGGAIGNVVDRIRIGAVVDFLDIHYQGWHWPAFNIADSAIVCGALLMILDGVLSYLEERKAAAVKDNNHE